MAAADEPALTMTDSKPTKIFEIATIKKDSFPVPSAPSNTSIGKVTCSVPFTAPDGQRLFAIGTEDGVWVCSNTTMCRKLELKMVTQCTVLQQFSLFIVLADKNLFAYRIKALLPSSLENPETPQNCQKLNRSGSIRFFRVGVVGGVTRVDMNEERRDGTTFTSLEPWPEELNAQPHPDVGDQRLRWFGTRQAFGVSEEAFDIFFLKSKVAILTANGFEIQGPTLTRRIQIPFLEESHLSTLSNRFKSTRPIGLFRCNADEFLICYEKFGLYVDKHGDPSRLSDPVTEWEGTAQRAALHHPYILLFNSKFIEVRHVNTGHILQVIPGENIRMIWDRRDSPASPGDDTTDVSQKAHVHVVMDEPDVGTSATIQHVFELIPAIPL